MKLKSIKKNYLYNLIYQLFLIIVPVLVTPYVSRILLADGVGKYSYTLSLVTYFTLVAMFGFTSYGQRLIARENNKASQSKVFWEIFISKLIICLFVLVIYFIFIFFGVFGDKYNKLMLIQSINIVSCIFDINYLFYGNEEFKGITIRNFFVKAVTIAAIFIFVKKYDDLLIYVLIQSLSLLISSLSIWLMLSKYICKIKFKDLKIFKHFKPAFLIFLPGVAVTIYTVLDKTLIGVITQNDSYVGNYENAEKLVKICITVVSSLGTVYSSQNAYYYQTNNYEMLKKNVFDMLCFVGFLSLPMCFGLASIVDNMIPWYLGNEYGNENISSVISMIKVLSPIIVIIGFGTCLGNAVLIACDKEVKNLISVSIAAVINFILNIIFINVFGAIGACFSTVIAELTCCVLYFVFASNYIELKKIFSRLIKPIVSSTIMFIICILISYKMTSSIINTILLITLGGFVYFICELILQDKMIIDVFKKIKQKLHNTSNT